MLWSGLRMPRFLRPSLAGPALGALSLLAILALLQRPAPLFVNLGAGDEAMRLEIVPLHDDEDGRPVVTYAFAPAEHDHD